MLTKSRYMAGLQCLRRLWLQVHEPVEINLPAPGSLADIGQEIGRNARLLFAGGALVDAAPWERAEAVARTAALMRDASVPAIFEAAFCQEDVHVRADILERRADGWGLIRVKSSTSVKDHHLEEIALQAWVMKEAGVTLAAIEVMHVNNTYVRGAEGIDWTAYFARVDVAADIHARIQLVPLALPEMHEALDAETQPYAEPGPQCTDPYLCPFWDRCTADKPRDWVQYMPRLPQAQKSRLAERGIVAISDIPLDFPLSWKQGIIRNATITGEPYIAPDLARVLRPFGPPACYLDFEAMMPPIPLYEGTRPYQTLPFQWSLHIAQSDGTLSHAEFLAQGDEDPRRAFATSLIAALADTDTPIVVYSPYEMSRLNELAARFPDLADAIGAITHRLVDLLPVVRGAVYFPAFEFSNSIKFVAPALCPGFGYDDLDGIADGIAASEAFGRLASGAITDPAEDARLRQALLAYCERDTLAMVVVHQALAALV